MIRASAQAKWAAAAAMLSLGCSHTSQHSLEAPAQWSASETRRPCSVGVARVVDEQGVNFALDLRDFLRESGPCRDVRVVSDPTSDQAEYVVSGHFRGKLEPTFTPERLTGTGAATAGAVGLVIGTELIFIPRLFPNPTASAASNSKTNSEFGKVGITIDVVSGVVLLGGLVALLHNRGVHQIDAPALEADIEITRGSDTAARLVLRDTVEARAAPLQRTKPHNLVDYYAAIQREVVRRVFEHVAAKLDELSSERAQATLAPETDSASKP